MSFSVLTRWVQAGLVASLAMCLVLIGWPLGPLMTAYNQDYVRVFWSGGPMPAPATAHHGFLMGVTAAGVIGWAITLLFVVAHPWQRRERWAWQAIAVSVAAWAGIDIAVSLFHGVVAEALFAGAAGVGLLLPVLLARPHFATPAASTRR